MRRAVARVQELGGLDAGPLPDGFASLQSSLSALHATFGWGDVSAILAHGVRSAEIEGPDSPWRPVIAWGLGWAHYVRDELEEAERWLSEAATLAPRTDQWIVGVAAIADLSLIAGRRGDRDEQMRLAREAVDVARSCGLLDAIEDGEVHSAYGVALIAHGRADEAIPELERGVFLRRLWGQQLDLSTGSSSWGRAAPSSATHPAPSRRSTKRTRCSPPAGTRVRCPRGSPRPGAPCARPGAARSSQDRERTVLRLLGSGLSEREIGRELYLSFNTVHSHVKAIYRKLGVTSRADAVRRSQDFT